ncbi:PLASMODESMATA CALLOSE-BINDING PROTEIN 2-like isoform X2 [Henckelia pumila]|uniref:PLASMODESMATA CALLOSE-BINDING PROTEIN 2-like isoform X2 n=1 Tax=Henckelia pumila TaxID=405737 RepID=UPI003C6DCC6E
MAVFVMGLLLLLAMVGYSDAAYCLCSSGGDSAFQKNIDYACGAGADCSAITQNGACFNPNTVRDHCNYAVNSYYQKKGQISGSCDFAGTATVSQTAPSMYLFCVYPSSSSGGSTTPTTNPTFGGTPTTNPTFGGTPNSSTSGNTTGAMPGSTFTSGFGLAPAGTGFGNPDGSSALSPHVTTIFNLLSFVFALLFCPRI